MHQFLLNYFKNILKSILNTFSLDFLWIWKDSRENPGKSLGNPCKSKENQRKMYSNGFKNILSIIYSCFFLTFDHSFLF